MPRFRVTNALQPGKYLAAIVDGQKVFKELTADDLAKHALGTKQALNKGYLPPFILEHAPLGQVGPIHRNDWNSKADKLRNTVGYVTDVVMNKDGSVGYDLEVTDNDIYQKLSDKTIRYTSPELRENMAFGDGEIVPGCFAHVAATVRPRNMNQSQPEAIAMAMQFSLDDLEEETKTESDMPEEKSVEEVKSEEVTEEMPVETDGDMIDFGKIHKSVYESLVAVLKAKGLALPEDMQPASLFSVLLAELSKAQSDESSNEMQVENAPTQYSLDNLDKAKPSKLLAKAIRSEAERVKQNIKAVKLPGLVAGLEKLVGSMQFSADAEELPTIKVSDVVKLVNSAIPDAMAKILESSASQFSAVDHPQIEFLNGGEITAEQAKKIVDKQAEVVSLLKR